MHSELQALQQELARVKAQRDELRSLFKGSPDTFYRANLAGEIVFASPSVQALLGEPPEELAGKKLASYYADPNGRDQFLSALAKAGGHLVGYEALLRRPDGQAVWVSTSAHYWHDEQGAIAGVEGVVRDISHQVQLERRGRLLARALAVVEDGVAIFDADFGVVYANPAFFAFTGLSTHDYGLPLSSLLSDAGPPLRALRRAIADQTPWQGPIPPLQGAEKPRPALLTYAPVTPPNDERPFHALLLRDTTSYDLIASQLAKAQNLEVLGVLVGGLAHDFNNLIASIQTNVFLARASLDVPDPDVIESLDAIQSQSARAAGLIQQLNHFAKEPSESDTPVSLGSALVEALGVAQGSLPEDVHVETRFAPELAPSLGTTVDAELFSQLLVNLFSNAADATAHLSERRLVVACEFATSPPDILARFPHLPAGPLVSVSVTDNGQGMTAEQLGHIFEPFYTTKTVGKGTGLGLSMVYQKVRQHSGAVDVHSTPGEGTTINMILPLHTLSEQEPVAVEPEPPPPPPVVRTEGRATLLLVDDEPFVRRAMERVFRHAGYRVLTAADGLDALEVLQDHEEIALVVFDVVMPRLGGVEAAIRARESRPDLPILFATGYDRDSDLARFPGFSEDILLRKPFEIEDLLAAVAMHLPVVEEEE